FRRNAILVALPGKRVWHSGFTGQVNPDLGAVRGRNPALLLQFAPRNVVPFGSDQAEDVFLQPVFANKRRGKAQPPARLDLGRRAEYRGRQQVNLVVNDQSPVALVEDLEVREVF